MILLRIPNSAPFVYTFCLLVMFENSKEPIAMIRARNEQEITVCAYYLLNIYPYLLNIYFVPLNIK